MAYQFKTTKYSKEFPEAYFKIHSVHWKSLDEEIQESLEDGSILTKWKTVHVAEAIVLIYGDKVARENRVSSLELFKIKFDFDLYSKLNAVRQAYNILKTIPEFEGGIDV